MMSSSFSPAAVVCKGQFVDLSTPAVMGIVNVTPDSFFDGGHYTELPAYVARAKEHVEAGATWLDLGGYSTRPGAAFVSEEEEIARLLEAVKVLKATYPEAWLSIDTFRSKVARACLEAGADAINDISGGTLDEEMFAVVAEFKAPYILMHMRGTPQTMQEFCDYPAGLTIEMNQFFAKQVALARAAGVHSIILDPGFGFSKTLEQNYELMRNLTDLHVHGLPLLAGISRKSMLYKALGGTPASSLNGTTFLNTIALEKGAAILRVHDVKEAVECVQLTQWLNGHPQPVR